MTNIPMLPGYALCEYLLVLSPHEDLRNRIKGIKKDFADAYRSTAGLYDKPVITLAIFKQYALTEDRIIQHLHTIAMGAKPLKIEMKGFGSFPTHTIYINVTSKLPLQGLVKQVRSSCQGLMKLDADNKPHFLSEPHINIARKLQPWQYEKGWLEYSHRSFTGRFIADAMLLLKRPAGEKKYQIASRFEFQHLPVATTQGELFG